MTNYVFLTFKKRNYDEIAEFGFDKVKKSENTIKCNCDYLNRLGKLKTQESVLEKFVFENRLP